MAILLWLVFSFLSQKLTTSSTMWLPPWASLSAQLPILSFQSCSKEIFSRSLENGGVSIGHGFSFRFWKQVSVHKCHLPDELPGHCHDPSQESLMRHPLRQLTKELVWHCLLKLSIPHGTATPLLYINNRCVHCCPITWNRPKLKQPMSINRRMYK